VLFQNTTLCYPIEVPKEDKKKKNRQTEHPDKTPKKGKREGNNKGMGVPLIIQHFFGELACLGRGGWRSSEFFTNQLGGSRENEKATLGSVGLDAR